MPWTNLSKLPFWSTSSSKISRNLKTPEDVISSENIKPSEDVISSEILKSSEDLKLFENIEESNFAIQLSKSNDIEDSDFVYLKFFQSSEPLSKTWNKERMNYKPSKYIIQLSIRIEILFNEKIKSLCWKDTISIKMEEREFKNVSENDRKYLYKFFLKEHNVKLKIQEDPQAKSLLILSIVKLPEKYSSNNDLKIKMSKSQIEILKIQSNSHKFEGDSFYIDLLKNNNKGPIPSKNSKVKKNLKSINNLKDNVILSNSCSLLNESFQTLNV